MQVEELDIPGCVTIEQDLFTDFRGTFEEHFNAGRFRDAGLPGIFTQDNISVSKAGVIRGLHVQRRWPQGKLIRVLKGRIYDVCVDARLSSPTFGKFEAVILDDKSRRSFYVPEGCAHGFM